MKKIIFISILLLTACTYEANLYYYTVDSVLIDEDEYVIGIPQDDPNWLVVKYIPQKNLPASGSCFYDYTPSARENLSKGFSDPLYVQLCGSNPDPTKKLLKLEAIRKVTGCEVDSDSITHGSFQTLAKLKDCSCKIEDGSITKMPAVSWYRNKAKLICVKNS